MPEKLEDWDPRWNEPYPQIFTLREHIINLQKDMAMINSVPGDISSINSKITNFEIKVENIELNLTLLQLHVLGKITAIEMGNLLRMVKSVDPENHVIAHETVNQLLKTIT